MACDPAIGKRRRKALTQEVKELLNEIATKADQIYALCDVNEDFRPRPQFNNGDQTEDLIRSLTLDVEH